MTLSADSPESYLRKAEAHIARGEVSLAATLLSIASSVHNDYRLFAALGRLYLLHGTPADAYVPLNNAIRLNPGDVSLRLDLMKARPKDAKFRLFAGGVPDTPKPYLCSFLAVSAASLLHVADLIRLSHFLSFMPNSRPLILIIYFIVACSTFLFLGISGQFPVLSQENVVYSARRPFRAYWEVPTALFVLGAIAVWTSHGHPIVAQIALLAFRVALSGALLLATPGARPLYVLLTHTDPQRRQLLVKYPQGFSQWEHPVFAIRMEDVNVKRSPTDLVLFLSTVRIHFRGSIAGKPSLDIKLGGPASKAGEWREAVTQFIAESRRVIEGAAPTTRH